jgi:hypothetical protein
MPSKIQQKINKNKDAEGEGFIKTVIMIMKIFHYTYDEVMDLPIPVYIEIIKFLKENGNK